METDRSKIKLDQILVAAQKRFGLYGLSKTTMNEIADDIGLSKASLYYYFKDKESIFKAVVEKEQEQFVLEMKKTINSRLKAEKMLVDYVKLRLELLKKMLTLGKFNFESLMEIKPVMSSFFQEFRKKEIKMIVEILNYGIE